MNFSRFLVTCIHICDTLHYNYVAWAHIFLCRLTFSHAYLSIIGEFVNICFDRLMKQYHIFRTISHTHTLTFYLLKEKVYVCHYNKELYLLELLEITSDKIIIMLFRICTRYLALFTTICYHCAISVRYGQRKTNWGQELVWIQTELPPDTQSTHSCN